MNASELLSKGKLAATSGQKDLAREALQRAIELEPSNEEAWLWLSGVASNLPMMRQALEHVLSINPNNLQAKEGLQWVTKREQQLRAMQPSPAPMLASSNGQAVPKGSDQLPSNDQFTAAEEGDDDEEEEAAPIVAPQRAAGEEPLYPNAGLNLLFRSVEKVTGEKGVNALLNMAGLHQYVGNFPPNDMEFTIRYSDYSAFGKAMEDFYGPASKSLQRKVGREIFNYGINEQPRLLGVVGAAMKFMPLTMKTKLTLNKMVNTARGLQVPTHLEESDDAFTYVMEVCPYCYARETTVGCNALSGTINTALNWATGKNFHVEEVTCRGKGDTTCSYRVGKTPVEA